MVFNLTFYIWLVCSCALHTHLCWLIITSQTQFSSITDWYKRPWWNIRVYIFYGMLYECLKVHMKWGMVTQFLKPLQNPLQWWCPHYSCSFQTDYYIQPFCLLIMLLSYATLLYSWLHQSSIITRSCLHWVHFNLVWYDLSHPSTLR
jgi:hypothetical protein